MMVSRRVFIDPRYFATVALLIIFVKLLKEDDMSEKEVNKDDDW